MSKPEPTPRHYDYSVPSHAESAHEQVEFDREIQYKQLILMGAGLLVMAAVSGVIVFVLLKGFIQASDKSAPPPPLVGAAAPAILGPKLLARPEAELQRVREAEQQQLESYGWVDPQQGLARIPIERALAIVAAQGKLPEVSSAAATTPAAAPTATPKTGAELAPAPTPPPGRSPTGPGQAVPLDRSPGGHR